MECVRFCSVRAGLVGFVQSYAFLYMWWKIFSCLQDSPHVRVVFSLTLHVNNPRCVYPKSQQTCPYFQYSISLLKQDRFTSSGARNAERLEEKLFGGGGDGPHKLFWNRHRTAGRIALKFWVGYNASFVHISAKRNWQTETLAGQIG